MEGNRQLSLWGIRIIPISVSVTELSLAIVDEHFRLLVNSNLPCASYCVSLCVEGLGNTSVTFTFNTPPSVIRNYMLILSHTLSFMD